MLEFYLLIAVSLNEREQEMEITKNIIKLKTYEKSQSKKVACSKCGRVLVSSHEGIVGNNNIAFCEYCYQSLLFPHFREHYMEITD